jgi:A/G-specific adenine glycosylase
MGKESRSTTGVGAVERERIKGALISWFEGHARDLPRRRTRDPWRVLVSEVMLQQIQVQRAVPFYERFLARFPTLEALADAPLAQAIRVWEDLGRYRRIVYLHKTARILIEEHDGRILSDPEDLQKLPGIGPYTAGAVACFAFERDAAFMDTNLRMVLRRYFFGLKAATSATEKEILQIAKEFVPSGRGWLWNQALMETGALVCTARRPRCEGCPLREGCRARMETTSAGWPKLERKVPAYRYENSNRYYRGRVLVELRRVSSSGGAGIVLRELGRRVRQDFEERDPYWLYAAVESLSKDRLATVSPGLEAAGAPEMVAKERASYRAGPEESQGPGLDDRVSLP